MLSQYHRWFSPRLQRDMELLVFGHAGARTLVFPTRSGRFYDYENWGQVECLRQSIEAGNLQLFCVDSIDGESLYCERCSPQARLARYVKFEDYIVEEVVPFSRWINSNDFAIAHGCSIGAYHAVNLALRRPDIFGKVVGLSGRYNLTRGYDEFRDLFSGYYDENVYFHTPPHFVRNLTDPSVLEKLRRLEIILAVGESDQFLEANQDLSRALWDVGVWNRLEVWPGEAHRACYWKQMTPAYL